MLRRFLGHLKRYLGNERGTSAGIIAGVTWGGLAASAAAGAGAAGAGYALSGGGGEDGMMRQGYDVVTLPQYSFTEPRLRLASDFVSDNISRMSRGEYPSYYGKALPKLRENMSRPNYQTYFGRPGDRSGTVNDAMAMGAMTGLKGKTAMAPANKLLKDYADKETAIDEYLTKMGVDVMMRDATAFPALAAAMPKGPDAQVVSYGGFTQPATNDSSALLNALGNYIGNSSLNLGNATTTTPTYDYNYWNSKNKASTIPTNYDWSGWNGVTSQPPAGYSNAYRPGNSYATSQWSNL
jgi:hypothetical protein